jgi:hypothetical protein
MQKVIYIFSIILFGSFTVFSGTSIFGLAPNSFGSVYMGVSTSAAGRGGFEIAYFDSLSVNNSNFAQWPFLTQTTINLNAEYQRLSTEANTQTTSSYAGNFDGGYLAIPIMRNKFALGFGITPLLRSEQTVSEIKNTGSTEVEETLKSTGNVSEGSFSVSYAFNENMAIAGVIAYNFGLIEDNLLLNYNSVGYSDILLENRYKIYGKSFALHTFYKIQNNLFSGLRIKFPTTLTLKTEQNSLNANEYVVEDRTVEFPLNMSLGMAYLFENQYIAGVDFNYQSWKDGYKIDEVKPEGFDNSYRFSAGIEKMQSDRRFISYGQRMYYRAGLYFGQLNLLSNNKNINEYGITLGLGFPILNPKNRIDLALQYGIRGSLDKNKATENLIKLNISITAGNLWFVREDN